MNEEDGKTLRRYWRCEMIQFGVILALAFGFADLGRAEVRPNPAPGRPRFETTFTITDGAPVLPPPPEQQGASLSGVLSIR